MAIKSFIQLGQRKGGKIDKNESYTIDDFIEKLMTGLPSDIKNALDAYAKKTNLENSIRDTILSLIENDND